MTTTILAVYENGVLRPAQPLPLAEGETVQVTITPSPSGVPTAEAEAVRRMNAATTLQELYAAYDAAPPPPNGYDLVQALEENRRLAGELPLYPNGRPEDS
jgi:predicted DNA-binding antitoxin AbrB/MazE fold protein